MNANPTPNPRPKSQAAGDVADCLKFFPDGATVRQLVDKYRSVLFDAGITDDEHAIQMVSKKLSARAEQGLITRGQGSGSNAWIYYPPATPASVATAEKPQGIENEAEAAYVVERRESPLPEEGRAAIAAAILQEAAIEADIAKAKESPEESLRRLFDQRTDTMAAVIRQMLKDAWHEGHNHAIQSCATPEMKDTITSLRNMAEGLRPVRSDWSITAESTADHLESFFF